VHQVHRRPVQGVVEVPAADPGEHLVDQVDPGRWHQLRQARHRGRQLGSALGDRDRLVAEGCVWASSGVMINDCARIREGGEVLDRIELDRPCFAAMLGGPDRRTLFMLTADWRGTEGMDEVIRQRTGQVLVADAPAPGVGWP
jgi:hypothetical protein